MTEPTTAAAASGLDPGPQTLGQAIRELLVLSIPFILSSSFTTIQVFIDRLFISTLNEDAIAATVPTVGYFWTPLALLQFTALYVTVFVAQYIGAKRPERVGPVVWQGLYFAVIAGCAFPLLIPVIDAIVSLTNHAEPVKELETIYFRGLSLAALPTLIVAAVNGFFAGRQQSWTVFWINSTGALVNALCAVPLILGQAEDPSAAMFGAGLAMAIGSWVSALLALGLIARKRHRLEYQTLSGWRFDPALFRRLMKFGLPNGTQYFIEGLAFTAFILLVGNIGKAELAASNVAFSLNLLTFLPVMGLGQGVEVLVGQRQGEERPHLSARTTHAGALLGTLYMSTLALIYIVMPETVLIPFTLSMKPEEWAALAPIVPVLLRFIAVYSLADGANIIYAFGLRGAGDTRFVTLLAIAFAWPVMVLPTYFCWLYGWGLFAAWGFATAYVMLLALAFWLRFLGGRWRTMKVIESSVVEDVKADETPVAAA